MFVGFFDSSQLSWSGNLRFLVQSKLLAKAALKAWVDFKWVLELEKKQNNTTNTLQLCFTSAKGGLGDLEISRKIQYVYFLQEKYLK